MTKQEATRRVPQGIYPCEFPKLGKFKATGEFRNPKRGEFYLSGAIVMAWRAPNDMSTPFWIAQRVRE